MSKNKDDAKREYLIRTFSQTGKKYENYILNAIWHKLGRSDIQPVTQQYFKRSDGRYALVDLYFPQLGIGVECDEAYHIENAEEDYHRELTMEQMLLAYDATKDYEPPHRIKAYETLESIEKQIDDVVAIIKERICKGGFLAWNFNEPAYKVAVEKRQICVEDRFAFRTIVDVCRCFGKDYKRMQHSCFDIGHGYALWCPKLAIDVAGEPKSAASGWLNTLTDDWEYIFETNDDPDKIRKVWGGIQESPPRITFAQSRDILGQRAYRFIGIYEYDGNDPRGSDIKAVYKRTDQKIDLTPWLATK